MLPCEEKTKCLPPGVHIPQHSACGSCHPASRGCEFFPSADISQRAVALVFWSCSVRRNILPSGDHCGEEGQPSMLRSLRASDPSLLAKKRSFPRAYTSRWPSGDQAAAWPTASPRRRGKPPSTGNAQSGPSNAVPGSSETKSEEPSDETLRIRMLSEGAEIATASPPVLDTWPIEEESAVTDEMYCK